ncbi:uncharacterized protein LTR77_005126 [Saxophila tyrrhenica]|uniref:Nuclear distribution protein RO10 n=1 Tax=Saxophila tyrrhenica TaxID=1690608 RepID=A0AAV9PF58_9PEZI|nr:hypothetical protein LTR77_005126 [Saxophila tyrrhenica]
MTTSKAVSADTLSLLETRLQRLDYLLNGDTGPSEETTTSRQHHGSAAARLRVLERSLQSLATKSPTVNEILFLQKHHPDLFTTSSPSTIPSTLPTTSLASLVLAHENLYRTTSTHLTHLQDLTIPDPAPTSKLIDLRPRIDAARTKQLEQAKEVAELRARSARAVEAWYEGGVLGMDEQWAEWEERLREAEILVRRREAGRRREEGVV